MTLNAAIKRHVHDGLNALPQDLNRATSVFASGLIWHGQHPVNDGVGRDGWLDGALRPLLTAMPDLERRDDIVTMGQQDGEIWVATAGHYVGTFDKPLFGIPATGHLASLRYGEFHRVDAQGLILEVVTLWDLIGLMQQAGVDPLPPSPGIPLFSPGPRRHDGVRLDTVDPVEGAKTLALMMAMGNGLAEYDGKTLESMAQERFWSPTMLWYGPAGIGSNRRLKGFQDFHQRPFLTAFPDRRGAPNKVRIGDGDFIASRGWPSLEMTHTGPWLGHPATGRAITMRVMDWWRREGDWLAENWVYIDIPHVFGQFGRDLFAEMRALAAKR
ncbi:MAG: ester cyclase [Beijerinckiaceae bacterium]|jgi:predicted ester cyclase|nr:ester cyclase [Beijerinckiaceae bacterium]